MTRQELSKLEVKINVVTLWSIIGGIVIGAFIVTRTYSDIMWNIRLMSDEIKILREEIKELKKPR